MGITVTAIMVMDTGGVMGDGAVGDGAVGGRFPSVSASPPAFMLPVDAGLRPMAITPAATDTRL